MDRLLQIGFRDIGRWTLAGDGLQLQLDTLPTHRRALYAFATESTLLYVGKTVGTLPGRLQAYVSPHQSQRTNVRNRAALLDLLRAETKVRILGWIDPGLHRVGPFDLNMAAGLEDSIIALLAPPWNGARMLETRRAASPIQPQVLIEVPSENLSISSASDGGAQLLAAATAKKLAVPLTSIPNTTQSSAHGSVTGSTFTVRLGKTYYERGFFNVPVAFSELFGSHGATVDLYCGTERALVRAILDRKANQQSGTPRIYGKIELGYWFQRRFKLDDVLKVTVLSPTAAVLM
ncbi:hypothetical protein [Massilia sp. AB1]|uniref:hypothetical protein n=1 Tax=Massilia sp. AB1 TaxID=2823371 RepID=UPI001B83F4C1|nr:hypothetical protein [Massilia sp. AB1]MBQ5940404.1 hypothetical protein [Massilia sp. AB1]